jgi:hypothetical protein
MSKASPEVHPFRQRCLGTNWEPSTAASIADKEHRWSTQSRSAAVGLARPASGGCCTAEGRGRNRRAVLYRAPDAPCRGEWCGQCQFSTVVAAGWHATCINDSAGPQRVPIPVADLVGRPCSRSDHGRVMITMRVWQQSTALWSR